MSIYSLAIIIERFVTLNRIREDSEKMNEAIKDILHYKRFDILDSLKSDESIHSKALSVVLDKNINPEE